MADSIRATSELSIGLDYSTGDGKGGTANKTIYLKLPNPRDNLTETLIRTQMESFLNANIILSPESTTLVASSVSTAFITNEEKIDIDIDG